MTSTEKTKSYVHIVELHQHHRNSTLHLLQPNTAAKDICWNQMRNYGSSSFDARLGIYYYYVTILYIRGSQLTVKYLIYLRYYISKKMG